MFCIRSAAIIGIDASPVTVEADIAFGMPGFQIVGLPDTSVKESRERIRAAIRHANLPFPRTRVTVNLAPADIKKQGPAYDLPIALALLAAQGETFDTKQLESAVVIGELALNGDVRPVPGVLSAALMARRNGFRVLFVPEKNAVEAASIPRMRVIGIPSLTAAYDHLTGRSPIPPTSRTRTRQTSRTVAIDLQDIRGQEQAKRGLEIAAAGGHNLLLKGPPGTGKTMLARALPGLLPPLSVEESLEVSAIASVSGGLPEHGLLFDRPFRAPHHSSSAVALTGGGAWPKPGEVTLAHRGILFLDEFPEFSRRTIEHLRQPIEDGEVVIARAAGHVRFPARFLLVAAMNPCPCGFLDDLDRPCTCHANAIQSYARRVSGPILDRFDLVIDVPRVDTEKLLGVQNAEPSAAVRKRVEMARKIATKRFGGSGPITNAEIPPSKLNAWSPLDEDGTRLLTRAITSHHLSARAVARVRKVARTIADLTDAKLVTAAHLAEALQFRLSEE